MNNFNFRKATIRDLSLVMQFQTKLIKYEQKLDPLIKKGKDVQFYTKEEMKKRLKSKNSYFMIIEYNKKPISLGMAMIKPVYGNWCKYQKRGMIGLMYIEKDYRGKGIGKELLENLVKWLKENNIKLIELKVYANNKSAIELYKKQGFKEYISEMRL